MSARWLMVQPTSATPPTASSGQQHVSCCQLYTAQIVMIVIHVRLSNTCQQKGNTKIRKLQVCTITGLPPPPGQIPLGMSSANQLPFSSTCILLSMDTMKVSIIYDRQHQCKQADIYLCTSTQNQRALFPCYYHAEGVQHQMNCAKQNCPGTTHGITHGS